MSHESGPTGFLTSKSLAVRFSRFGNYVESDLGPASSQLPKGEYTLRLYLRHDNVQYLEKMKQLVLFLERNLEEKDVIPLNFFSEPDGPVMGNGTFKYSILVPGIKESFYLSPPNKDKLPKCSSQGSVLLGAISHGKLSYAGEGKNPQKNPVSYQISYVVPPSKAFCSCKTHGGSQY